MNIDKMLEKLEEQVEVIGKKQEVIVPVSYFCLRKIIEVGRDHSQEHVTINLINNLEDRTEKYYRRLCGDLSEISKKLYNLEERIQGLRKH